MKKLLICVLLLLVLYSLLFISREQFKTCIYKPPIIIGGVDIPLPLDKEINFMKNCICNEFNKDYFHCSKLLLKHYTNDLIQKIYKKINKNFTDNIIEKLENIDIINKDCYSVLNDFQTHSISILTGLTETIDNINITDDITHFIKIYKFIKGDIQKSFPNQVSEIPIPNPNHEKKKDTICFTRKFDIKRYIEKQINDKFIGDIKFIIDSIDTDETTNFIEMYDPPKLLKSLLNLQITEDNLPSISETMTESLSDISRVISWYYCMKSNIENKNNNCCKQSDCSRQTKSPFFFSRCKTQNSIIRYNKYECKKLT